MEISINGKRVAVASLKDARNAWIAYRDESGIGASGLKQHDGKVFQGRKLIATVSYNGRVWDVDGKPLENY